MDTGGPMDGLTADQCHSYASRSDGSLVGPRQGKWLLPRCWLRATKVCPHAASGSAAAPPSSDMNARRLNGPLLRLRAGDYHTVAPERRCASQQKLRADVADGSIATE
jgi:hypothetical protein